MVSRGGGGGRGLKGGGSGGDGTGYKYGTQRPGVIILHLTPTRLVPVGGIL